MGLLPSFKVSRFDKVITYFKETTEYKEFLNIGVMNFINILKKIYSK